jgi:peptide/nickel transport system substrate-binding protein
VDFAAFDRHALGRPRIGAIQLRWNSDPNTVLANLLAGDIQVSADDSIQSTHASILRHEWAPSNTGTILFFPTLWRSVQVQLRPELATPRSLLDVRVRRALAQAVDKQALNDTLFEGQGIMSDSMIPPTMPYFADLDRAVAKYPYDLRRTEQLMQEAGYTKGGDGIFTSPSEGRFNGEVKINGGAQYESEMSIMAAGWRQAGFEFREVVNPAALASDGETRSLFPSLWTASGPLGEDLVRSYTSAGIPRPETRWLGRNRVAWMSAEADRLIDAFNTTLDRSQRNQQIVQFVRIFTEELPEISLYFDPSVLAYVAALQGPKVIAPGGTSAWDIHQWELR